MEIRIRQKNNVIILDLSGVLDVNAGELVEIVARCLHDGYTDLLVNCEDVTSLDYMGVSVLVIAYKQVVNHNGRMKLAGIPLSLLKIVRISGIDKSIEIYASEQEALGSFTSDQAIDQIKKLPLRRRFKRLPMGIKGCLWSRYESNSCAQEVTVMNLSAVGAYVYGSSKFKLADEVVLCIDLAHNKETVELEGQVVWLADEQVQHRISPGMGVEFRFADKRVQQKLIHFIERNLSSMTSD